MNEFIVWYKPTQTFIKQEWVYGLEFDEGSLFNIRVEQLDDIDVDDCEIFYDIGKTDIDGNKIYADSSIVEFDIRLDHEISKKKGFVAFSLDEMAYGLTVDSGGFYEFTHYDIKNLKIIGTLQENKELLK